MLMRAARVATSHEEDLRSIVVTAHHRLPSSMGRKKGGKNPEGHRAGGARTGAGRPRKAGPLTLKASIRVHAHQPAAGK